MKKCLKCFCEKDCNDFGKDKHRKDCLNPYCKECIKKRNSEKRSKNPDEYKEYYSRYRQENRDVLRQKSYAYFIENKDLCLTVSRESYHRNKDEIAKRRKVKRHLPGAVEKENERQRKYRIKNPEKYRNNIKKWQQTNKQKHCCHQRVHRAVEDGILIRSKSCQKCDKLCVTEGHHEDYSKPLEVVWLCKSCHGLTRHKVKV